MRTLCIDYGDARIGLAVSDPMGIIASPLEVYARKKDDRDFEYLGGVIRDKEVDTVVLGLPLNMDGSKGERAQKSLDFGAELLARFPDIKVEYMDERLSTVSAERVLLEANMRRDKRKGVIDKIAAQIILQNYLDKTGR